MRRELAQPASARLLRPPLRPTGLAGSNRGPDLAITCHPPPQGTAAKASALTKKPAHGWPSCCVERVAYALRRVRALVFGIRLPLTFPATVTRAGCRAIRVLELFPRTVWRQEADSEAIWTYLRRVRGDKLQHSGGGVLLRAPANGLQPADVARSLRVRARHLWKVRARQRRMPRETGTAKRVT